MQAPPEVYLAGMGIRSSVCSTTDPVSAVRPPLNADSQGGAPQEKPQRFRMNLGSGVPRRNVPAGALADPDPAAFEPALNRRMMKRLPVFGPFLLMAVAATLLISLMVLRGKPFDRALSRGLFIGMPLMELREPQGGVSYPQGGLAILVHFKDDEGVAVETFRCLLNGQDLTHQLTRGRNGAGGALFPVREGPNRLRLEIFGKGWLGGRYYQEVIERIIEIRPLYHLERARRLPGAGRRSPA